MTETSVWLGAPLVLASRSEGRRALLKAVGIDAVSLASTADERAVEREFFEGGGRSRDLAQCLAKAKCLDVSERRPEDICLAADQTLLLDDEVFHKAKDRQELSSTLGRLAGRTHVLTSAACIMVGGQVKFTVAESAFLTMRPLNSVEIDKYVDVAWPDVRNSVGGYQIEGLGLHLFSEIVGNQSTIVGLPLLKLIEWFRQAGCLSI